VKLNLEGAWEEKKIHHKRTCFCKTDWLIVSSGRNNMNKQSSKIKKKKRKEAVINGNLVGKK
jgi:hypothetical protein